MNQELTQKLYDKYPELFGDNPGVSMGGWPADPAIAFDVGDGWYTLIDTLLELICADFNRAKKAFDENKDPHLHDMLAAEQIHQFELLPDIKQVKEKFGSLRFYAGTFTPAQKHYIDFAEAMSASICDGCGKLGEVSSRKGWLNCKCQECRTVSEETHFHG